MFRANRLTITQRVLLPVVVLSTVLTGSLAFYVHRTSRESTRRLAVAESIRTVERFKALRKYCTENVVRKVSAGSNLRISFDHEETSDTIPLPATMIHDMNEIMSESDLSTKLSLYSAHPFSHRRSRILDEFQPLVRFRLRGGHIGCRSRE